MAYTKNNVTFNSFDSNILARFKKIGNDQYLGASVDDLADIALDNGGKLPTTINSLEIDWNGADLANATAKWPSGTATINTTGVFIL